MGNDLIVPNEKTTIQTELILEEIYKAFRISRFGIARRSLELLVRRPAQSFVQLFREIEEAAFNHGLAAAARRGLREFIHLVKVDGNTKLPTRGPLLIVSNHVGAFDILVILSQILRNDLKVIASDVPFLRSFPILYQYLIFTDFQPGSGMQAARQALRHLKDGGALILFASAGIDPDPALQPQAALQELNNWKPSLDLFLRQVPKTEVVVSIVSGIVARHWATHPLTRLGKKLIDQRRIAEMLQIIEQLLFPGKLPIEPRIHYSTPLSVLEMEGDFRLALIRKAEEMINSIC